VSHMVIYRGTDGKPGYHQTDDIHDAVTFVEQLRNDQGVEHARIFRLEEVSFEYRPYFRVELKSGDAALSAAPSTPAVAAAPPAVAAAPPVMAAAPPAPAVEAPAPAVEAPAPKVEVPTESAAAKVEETAEKAAAPSILGTPHRVAAATEDAAKPAATEGDSGVGARRGLFGR
jgi:hypothetical protein